MSINKLGALLTRLNVQTLTSVRVSPKHHHPTIKFTAYISAEEIYFVDKKEAISLIRLVCCLLKCNNAGWRPVYWQALYRGGRSQGHGNVQVAVSRAIFSWRGSGGVLDTWSRRNSSNSSWRLSFAKFLLSFHAMWNSHGRDSLQTSLHLVLLKAQNLFVGEETLVLKGS